MIGLLTADAARVGVTFRVGDNRVKVRVRVRVRVRVKVRVRVTALSGSRISTV